MGLQDVSLFFIFPGKLYQIIYRRFGYFIHANLQKGVFLFFSKLWQEIHLFSKVIFIEFYGKPLNVSSYGQNLLSLPFSCQFLFFYNWISLALLTDYSKIFHSLVPLFSTLLNLLLKFSCSFFFSNMNKV